MSIAGSIRRYVNRLPAGQIFSTRELLHFGSRTAVDQSMYRMVRDGEVWRLAWGLFVRVRAELAIPSIEQIAAAKAKAFDKEVLVHGQDSAHELGITDSNNQQITFYVPGSSSSSFICVRHKRRVHFKATAARRLFDGNQRLGKVIRAFWQLGPLRINSQVLRKATINLNREELRTLRHAAYRVPWWLARFTNHTVTLAGAGVQ